MSIMKWEPEKTLSLMTSVGEGMNNVNGVGCAYPMEGRQKNRSEAIFATVRIIGLLRE